MPANLISQIDALLALGFTLADDGTLVAPADSTVTLAPTGQFYQLKISIHGHRRARGARQVCVKGLPRGGEAVNDPLHIATVGGQPLRFFKTPLNDGRPDFPWHCVDDLYCCLKFNRGERKWLQQKARIGERRTIATADGLVIVAPHCVAQGVIEAAIEMGRATERAGIEYRLGAVEAMNKIPTPPFPSDEYLDWMKAAMNRWKPREEPKP
jgi:hypothetical protein